ncbi:hypothetical protein BJ165DRAFT_1533623 [Panaeolus papilionaceus]|nr:hypothetical protein BJ165DRAFT_1533623 [Panaeolus papilionaceus]
MDFILSSPIDDKCVMEMETDSANALYYEYLDEELSAINHYMESSMPKLLSPPIVLANNGALRLCELNTNLLQFFSMDMLISWSRVCSTTRCSVSSALERLFKAEPWLRHVLLASEIYGFRYMLNKTQAVVSGSVALQCLIREHFTNVDDLDVYCCNSSFSEWLDYLSQLGFSLDMNSVKDYSHQRSPDGEPIFDWIGTFSRSGWTTKLQLIVCKNSPLEAVMGFHSSTWFISVNALVMLIFFAAVVVNIMTGTHIYCAFPKATLCQKISLIICSARHLVDMPYLQKYASRGYEIVHHGAPGTFETCHATFPSSVRHFGDSLSLKLQLHPVLPDIFQSVEHVESQYWSLNFILSRKQKWLAFVCYHMFCTPDLQLAHMVPSSRIAKALDIIVQSDLSDSPTHTNCDCLLVDIMQAMYS